MEKAVKLGLKKGPMFGMLTSGRSVMTEQGKEVKPEDVISPAIPGPAFMVVDCPTMEHFELIMVCE